MILKVSDYAGNSIESSGGRINPARLTSGRGLHTEKSSRIIGKNNCKISFPALLLTHYLSASPFDTISIHFHQVGVYKSCEGL